MYICTEPFPPKAKLIAQLIVQFSLPLVETISHMYMFRKILLIVVEETFDNRRHKLLVL